MTAYVLFLLGIFPLAVHNKYFDIRQFRLDLYWRTTCVVAILYLLLGILCFIYRKGSNEKTEKENSRNSIEHSNSIWSSILFRLTPPGKIRWKNHLSS